MESGLETTGTTGMLNKKKEVGIKRIRDIKIIATPIDVKILILSSCCPSHF
jgi:hypothetical protein